MPNPDRKNTGSLSGIKLLSIPMSVGSAKEA